MKYKWYLDRTEEVGPKLTLSTERGGIAEEPNNQGHLRRADRAARHLRSAKDRKDHQIRSGRLFFKKMWSP